ncbi:MAG: HEAT repeat domain-containing protein [Planctomycetota bacterium]|jgi:HEAT repeat protein
MRRFTFLLLAVSAALLWTLHRTARAERVGIAYRGPIEELSAHGGGDDDEDETDPGGATDPGGGDPGGGDPGGGDPGGGDPGGGDPGGGDPGGGDPGGGDPGAGDPGGGGVTPGGGGTGRSRASAFDGRRLWNWWWEYNKDRFLARATVAGRVNFGSAHYWFGSGSKNPPRQIVPVSGESRNKEIFPALLKALEDSNLAVRTEACIALGRLGPVLHVRKDKKEGESDNLVVQALTNLLAKRPTAKTTEELRYSAILGLGICGDPDGCRYLAGNVLNKATPETEKAYVLIALGLARHKESIPLIVSKLPRDSRRKPRASGIAAIHALGLMGPGALEDLRATGAIKALVALANPRGSQDTVVIQAVAALGRLKAEFKTVRKAFGSRSKDVQYNAVLAMANYGGLEETKDAKDAVKFLMTKAFRSGEGQIKNFSVFAAGDLASRLGPNSRTRTRIVKHLRSLLEKNDIYLQSCAAVACGVANDRGSTDAMVALLNESKDTHVLAAVCIGLGLLRHTRAVPTIRDKVMLQSRWEADGRGDAAVGLALSGDTNRIGDLVSFHNRKGLDIRIKRHTPLAIGVLGGKDEVEGLIEMFSKPLGTKAEVMNASGAVFALSFLRDQSQVATLLKLSQHRSAQVRGMAVIALGRIGARDRVDPLTRCFQNMSHNNYFRWRLLFRICRIA